MPDSYFLLSQLLRIIESVFFIQLLEHTLIHRLRMNLAVRALMIYLLHTASIIVSNCQIVRFLADVIIDFSGAFILYKITVHHAAFYTVFFYDLLFICDGMAIAFFEILHLWEIQIVMGISETYLLMSYVSRAFLIPLLYLFLWLFPKIKANRISYYLFVLPIIIFIIQLIFFPVDAKSLYFTHPEWRYFLVIIFIVSALIYFVIAQRHHYRQLMCEEQIQRLNIHRKEQLSYIQEIQKSHRGLTKFAHDTKHHLDLINSYISNANTEKAQSYLQELYSKMEHYFIAYTGNIDVDSIIHSKRQTCPGHVHINVTGKLPIELSWLETADLCILLANGLSNAIEASSKLSGATIELEFICREDWLIITIKNPAIMSDTAKQNRNPNHGLGISSMKDVTEKYNGTIKFQFQNNIFEVVMMLNRRTIIHQGE